MYSVRRICIIHCILCTTYDLYMLGMYLCVQSAASAALLCFYYAALAAAAACCYCSSSCAGWQKLLLWSIESDYSVFSSFKHKLFLCTPWKYSSTAAFTASIRT